MVETVCRGVYRRDAKTRGVNLTEAALEALWAEKAALLERTEAPRQENQELGRTRLHLQLEVGVLKKADEILKKGNTSIQII